MNYDISQSIMKFIQGPMNSLICRNLHYLFFVLNHWLSVLNHMSGLLTFDGFDPKEALTAMILVLQNSKIGVENKNFYHILPVIASDMINNLNGKHDLSD